MNKMSEKDYAIGAVGLPQVGKVSNKPRYLIQLTPQTFGKSVPLMNFIALDKPGFEAGFISVKGFYCDKNEEEVVASFTDLINEAPKEMIQDLLIPNHRVHCIRSLVFNANKPSTLIKNG
jgi:hypothetical protein